MPSCYWLVDSIMGCTTLRVSSPLFLHAFNSFLVSGIAKKNTFEEDEKKKPGDQEKTSLHPRDPPYLDDRHFHSIFFVDQSQFSLEATHPGTE